MLYEYQITYRPGGECLYRTLSAFRVEAWKTAFAFFADGGDLKNPTTLVPIDLVQDVSIIHSENVGMTGEYEPETMPDCKALLRDWIENDISRWLDTDKIWKGFEPSTSEVSRGKLILKMPSGYRYSISFRPVERFDNSMAKPGDPIAEDRPSYLGCIVSGPDGKGNDLPDGRLIRGTWLTILHDIVSYELRDAWELSSQSKWQGSDVPKVPQGLISKD